MKRYVLVRNGTELDACFGAKVDVKEPTMHATLGSSTNSKWPPVTSTKLLPIRVLKQVDDAGMVCIQFPEDDKDQSRWLHESQMTLVNEIENRKVAFGMELPTDKLSFFDCVNASASASEFGRFCVAKSPLQVGAKVYEAPAFAMVLRDQFRRQFCQFCFEKLVKKAFQCAQCQQALYCSRQCLERDQVLHDFQCSGLERLDQAFCQENNNCIKCEPLLLDHETIRLALAALSVEHHILSITNSKSSQMQVLVKLFVPPSLLSDDDADNDRHKSFDQAAKFLVDCCQWPLEYDHALAMLHRVKANAHPFSLDPIGSPPASTATTSETSELTTGSLMACEAIGLFPLAAMCLNHSCEPNVLPVFDAKTRSLSFRAIKNIATNDVIEYSYLSDLFQSSHRRQQLLRDGFGFDCRCNRCVPSTEASDLQHAEDQHEANDEEEARFMQSLMKCASSMNPKADFEALLSDLAQLEHQFASFLTNSASSLFSLLMLRLTLARGCQQIEMVLSTCEQMTALWHQEALPSLFPTMQMVHQTAAMAARQIGDKAREQSALAQLDRFGCLLSSS